MASIALLDKPDTFAVMFGGLLKIMDFVSIHRCIASMLVEMRVYVSYVL